MKKVLSILTALFLVAGIAGTASADLTAASLYFTVTEESDNLPPVNQGGKENFFNLGDTINYYNGSQPNLGTWIDTNIKLSDFSNTANWNDKYVQIYGINGTYSNLYLFSSADPNYLMTFLGTNPIDLGINNLQAAITGDSAQLDKVGSPVTYMNQLQQGGDAPGTLGGAINAGLPPFGTEKNLNGLATGTLAMALYGGKPFEENYTYVGDPSNFLGQLDKLYDVSLRLDAADGSLQVQVGQVPIPAAVYLLGTGIVGLVAIRRRQQKA